MSASGQRASSPAQPQRDQGFPSNEGLLVFEQFTTLNTKSLRPAIKDEEMAWCDGWMPIGPNNLRTLYGIGPALYTAPSGTISYFNFWNIGSTPLCIVVLSNGSIQQINTNTGIITQIAPPGTIVNPGGTFDTVGWGSQYIVMCSPQTNGYFIWDGTSFYQAGTIGPDITITNSGSLYSSHPTITLITNGSGSGATFTATLENDTISTIQVTNPGSGFANGDLAALVISGGGSDTTATATASVSSTSGPVSGITLTGSATNVANTAYVTLDGGGGTGATAALSVVDGSIQAIVLTAVGQNYTSPPTVTFHDLGTDHVGTPSAQTQISTGSIGSISVPGAGSGYSSPPTVTVMGDGTGAQAFATINNTGQVSGITVTNGGFGYTKALVILTGGNHAASASVNLMPFGVSGNAIETYAGHVWVANGATILFSAPESVSDFAATDGGGAFTSNDSFLQIGYVYLKQSNGFLYLMGDSSLSYISGVNTSGTPPVTTFQNQNVDPQIGTPYHGTGQVFSRNIVFGNSLGIFVSYGGAVTKVSEPLDGIYNTVPNFGGFQLSSAVANIFGIEVYMQLTPVIDTYTGQQTNKLLMWNGKAWFTSQQDINLLYVASQKINSVLTAWGTDGHGIYPLFQQPSNAIQKTTQSKLWSTPHYLYTKTGVRLYGVLNFYDNDGEPVDITIDNETGSESYQAPPISNGIAWTNDSDETISWTNNANQTLNWTLPGITVFGPEAIAQFGRMLGMTMTTLAGDLSLISMTVMDQTYQANV